MPVSSSTAKACYIAWHLTTSVLSIPSVKIASWGGKWLCLTVLPLKPLSFTSKYDFFVSFLLFVLVFGFYMYILGGRKSSLYYFCGIEGGLTECGAHWFSKTCWLVSSGIILSSSAVGLQTGISIPTFYVDVRDPDSGSHSFIVSSEPSSPYSIITVSVICFCL